MSETAYARVRAWLALWSVLMLGVVYVSVWAFWSYTHQNLRFEQAPPGASIRTGKGSELRILRMWHTPTLTTERELQKSFEAGPGVQFVVIRYEITRISDQENCLVELAGSNGQHWEYSNKVFGRGIDHFCSDWPVGERREAEIIFEVPENRLDEVAGLYPSDVYGWRTVRPVATPPQG